MFFIDWVNEQNRQTNSETLQKREGGMLMLHKKLIAYLVSSLPAVYLAFLFSFHRLGANPVEKILHFSGDWAITLLCFSLTISPAVRFFQKPGIMYLRKVFGLAAFFYALFHFVFYLVFEVEFSAALLTKDIIKRPYITFGFIAFCILVVLALTSKKERFHLTGKQWKKIHRFVYAAAVFSVLHYIWLVKADHVNPLIYGSAITILLAVRVYLHFAKKRQNESKQYPAQ